MPGTAAHIVQRCHVFTSKCWTPRGSSKALWSACSNWKGLVSLPAAVLLVRLPSVPLVAGCCATLLMVLPYTFTLFCSLCTSWLPSLRYPIGRCLSSSTYYTSKWAETAGGFLWNLLHLCHPAASFHSSLLPRVSAGWWWRGDAEHTWGRAQGRGRPACRSSSPHVRPPGRAGKAHGVRWSAGLQAQPLA